MKKRVYLAGMVLGGMVFLTGCLFPRYTTICEIQPPEADSGAMTPAEASAVVRKMIKDVPAGHHPDHPGDEVLGRTATSVRLRKHNRTGLVLVEVFANSRVMMEFYVRTQKDGEKFSAAVWRLRREYQGK